MAKRKLYITYCSANKDQTKSELPAMKRYRSSRIDEVEMLAKKDHAQFMILSGRYGLLEPNDKIPYYDQILKALEVDALVGKVNKQIKKAKVDQVVFFSRRPEVDINIFPYLECVSKACEKGKVDMQISWVDG